MTDEGKLTVEQEQRLAALRVAREILGPGTGGKALMEVAEWVLSAPTPLSAELVSAGPFDYPTLGVNRQKTPLVDGENLDGLLVTETPPSWLSERPLGPNDYFGVVPARIEWLAKQHDLVVFRDRNTADLYACMPCSDHGHHIYTTAPETGLLIGEPCS